MSKDDINQDEVQLALGALAALEKEFEQVEVDILRETTLRQEPLFARRNKITSQIRNFWPLTFEQAAAALQFDEYITPEDAHLLTYLVGVNVTRPDVAAEPRSLQIAFEFAENEYFADRTLVKTFVHQSGGTLASEPVGIQWREGKDLTEGVTRAAVEAWEVRKGGGSGGEALRGMMESGPGSFFNWFLWTGLHEGLGEVHVHGEGGEDGPVEVFPNGEEVAVQIAEDMFPNAPKYFTEAMEEGDEDEDDEVDLDSDEEEGGKGGVGALLAQGKRNGGDDEDGPAKKKSKK